VTNQRHDDGANDGHDYAVKVQSADIALAEKSCRQKSADKGSYNSENDIQDEASPVLFTILLAMKPAMSPRISQATIDIDDPPGYPRATPPKTSRDHHSSRANRADRRLPGKSRTEPRLKPVDERFCIRRG
jgi:hypothetical protein